ncbi:uncharacterized protein BDR25DRAFT_355865 [Lindgomyces ingoldianus]|uniref:Uncharacterized protein n=1 Tax=Lindgomyces ingoldianus TaxID=673940 RepID=A0ACB6QUG9_9PLEO|nr:uncharacterized protein BDR25DRAFT_355865 [Lindgomyces ingoldianus]KAF2470155.1 hypothetical protein BDR25DRAFT_355865 [Lindgomyces ingoldianus]
MSAAQLALYQGACKILGDLLNQLLSEDSEDLGAGIWSTGCQVLTAEERNATDRGHTLFGVAICMVLAEINLKCDIVLPAHVLLQQGNSSKKVHKIRHITSWTFPINLQHKPPSSTHAVNARPPLTHPETNPPSTIHKPAPSNFPIPTISHLHSLLIGDNRGEERQGLCIGTTTFTRVKDPDVLCIIPGFFDLETGSKENDLYNVWCYQVNLGSESAPHKSNLGSEYVYHDSRSTPHGPNAKARTSHAINITDWKHQRSRHPYFCEALSQPCKDIEISFMSVYTQIRGSTTSTNQLKILEPKGSCAPPTKWASARHEDFIKESNGMSVGNVSRDVKVPVKVSQIPSFMPEGSLDTHPSSIRAKQKWNERLWNESGGPSRIPGEMHARHRTSLELRVMREKKKECSQPERSTTTQED